MNIAIVGGGRGGLNLLKAMETIDEFKICAVIDKDMNAVGMNYAKSLGIFCSNNLDDLLKTELDIIIEATGSLTVSEMLNNKYSHIAKVIDSNSAKIMMSMVDENIKVSSQLKEQITMIENTVNSLVNAVKKSNEYIVSSSELSKKIDKISNQIKILGLNANIEAARAGEHGKGFAVVAFEVQKLSDSSAQFVSEISSLLLSLSKEIDGIDKEVKTLSNHLS
jgi:methyl-accepting chemotaxis protein